MSGLGKILIAFGVLLIILGALLLLFGNIFSWFGRLPGDIRIERENFSFYAPFTSMILLSIVLSLIINFILRLLK